MNIFNYKWWWSKIGGRPWTFIMRDFYHKAELLIILMFFMIGYFARPHLSLQGFWVGIIILAVGYLLGHVLWGKKWIPGQRGR